MTAIDCSRDGRITLSLEYTAGIHIIEQDSKIYKLTEGLWPSWSPDGKYVAYKRLSGLYIIDSQGSNQKELIKGQIYDPDWSPTGGQIVFSQEDNYYKNPVIKILDLDTNFVIPIAEGKCPVWSPKGNAIAFIGANAIYTVSPNGDNKTMVRYRHVLEPPDRFMELSWSLDGKRILFIDRPRGNICIIDLESETLKSVQDLDAWTACWTFDGKDIIYLNDNESQMGLYKLPSDLTKPECLQKFRFIKGKGYIVEDNPYSDRIL